MAQQHIGPFDNLVELLQTRVAESPEKEAFIFLNDQGGEERISYRDIDTRARAIAAVLDDSGAVGAPVFLLYPPGIDYIAAFLGCVYAGALALPAYPPDPTRIDRTLPRLEAIMLDARPMLALTTAPIRTLGASLFARSPILSKLRWLATDTIDLAAADRYQEPEWDEEPLAFVQYTSGSTGQPKGVVLSHANLFANFDLVARKFHMDSDDRVVSWLPPYHDMGLIGGILQSLYVGAQSILLSPLGFLRQPRRWLDAVTKYRGTITGGPNFSYDLCVRKIGLEQREGLDLSTLKITYVAAEPIRARTLDAFHDAFAPCGFRRSSFWTGFGLAEATLVVSGDLHTRDDHTLTIDKAAYERGRVDVVGRDRLGSGISQPDTLTLVSCGKVDRLLTAAIVDPETGEVCGDDTVGEVWLSGPSIATGYWDKDEETEITFSARLHRPQGGNGLGEREFMRTGDLGFMHEGELYIAGRIKDLIIMHGRNFHPQDIEVLVESCHPDIRLGCSAAFSVDGDTGERLVVVAEVSKQALRDLRSEEMVGAVRRAVSSTHNVHVDEIVLITTSSIPKTSSGKIQRRATRTAFLSESLSLAGATA